MCVTNPSKNTLDGKIVRPVSLSRNIRTDVISRYSNTLLVTFNNRIALRNMTNDYTYGSGKSSGTDGVSARRPNAVAAVAVSIETFRAAPSSLSEQTTAAESFEFEVGIKLNHGEKPLNWVIYV